MLRGSSESSGMSSEEENITPQTASPPASPIEEKREPESIAGALREPETPKSTTSRKSFANMFRRPAEAKREKKMEKRKKQIWIFVRYIGNPKFGRCS